MNGKAENIMVLSWGPPEILLSNSSSKILTDASHRKHVGDREFVSHLVNILPRIPDGAVVSKIEDMMEEMVDCLIGEKSQLVINLKSKAGTTAVCFPGKSPKEAWKFTVLLRILELSHEALISGTIMTKRDMYYRDPELFESQGVVDRYIDDFAHTFGVERKDMNVVAAAKGLVTGQLQIVRMDGTTLNCSVEGGILIPPVSEIRAFNVPGDFEWILIVEKEATFRALSCTSMCESQTMRPQPRPGSLLGSGILVTGKGYPDLITREFVSCLTRTLKDEVHVFSATDYDPDGIGIHLTYKYGSQAHSHWSLTVPNAIHIGANSTLYAFWMNNHGLDRHLPEMRLSMRDRKLAARILDLPILQTDSEQPLREDLQRMLMLNIKAEMQMFDENHYFESWLLHCMDRSIYRV